MLDTSIEIALTVFVMLMIVAQLVAIKLRIPYTLTLVVIGIVLTALSAVALSGFPFSGTLNISVQWIRSLYNQLVGSGLFVGLVVPPLIFEAMIHIRREELRAVVRPSFLLATAGVILSTVVAGIVVWELEGLSLFSAMVFAVIIAPTDTITVLEIFKRVKVPGRLSTMMDMEAAFNDATAIVLFSIIISSAGFGRASIFAGIEVFLYSFVGGGLVGMVVAWIAKVAHENVNDKMAELMLTIAAVYGSYVLATSLGASGLIAVTIVGLYFGNSTMKRALTKRVKWSILAFWEVAAFIGNAIAFMLIGFDTNLSILARAAGLIVVAYASTIIARAAAVYPTFALFGYVGKKMRLGWGNIATIAGVRGALSIALLATLASSGAVSQSDLATITTMVMGVVFVSIIVQVPALSSYATRLFGRHRASYEA